MAAVLVREVPTALEVLVVVMAVLPVRMLAKALQVLVVVMALLLVLMLGKALQVHVVVMEVLLVLTLATEATTAISTAMGVDRRAGGQVIEDGLAAVTRTGVVMTHFHDEGGHLAIGGQVTVDGLVALAVKRNERKTWRMATGGEGDAGLVVAALEEALPRKVMMMMRTKNSSKVKMWDPKLVAKLTLKDLGIRAMMTMRIVMMMHLQAVATSALPRKAMMMDLAQEAVLALLALTREVMMTKMVLMFPRPALVPEALSQKAKKVMLKSHLLVPVVAIPTLARRRMMTKMVMKVLRRMVVDNVKSDWLLRSCCWLQCTLGRVSCSL